MKVPEFMDYKLHSVEVESLSFDEILILTFLVILCLKSYIFPLEKQKTYIKDKCGMLLRLYKFKKT